MRSNKVTPYLFLFPAIIGLAIFSIYPTIQAIVGSFYSFSFSDQLNHFVGLRNYVTQFTDPVFWNSIKVTVLFNLVINPLQIGLALGLAILLNNKLKGTGIFRTVHFIPIAVSLPVASVLFSIILNQNEGLVNGVLKSIGITAQPFFNSPNQALWVIVALATWKGVGYWTIFLLAGLQEIPESLYEASSIDGASRWEKFMNVTLPLMKRPLGFVAVADTVSNFLLFVPMYMITNGGPNDSTNVLMYNIVKSAYVNGDMGQAYTIIVVLLAILLSFIAIEFKLLKPKH